MARTPEERLGKLEEEKEALKKQYTEEIEALKKSRDELVVQFTEENHKLFEENVLLNGDLDKAKTRLSIMEAKINDPNRVEKALSDLIKILQAQALPKKR